jgi:hypothetical protein
MNPIEKLYLHFQLKTSTRDVFTFYPDKHPWAISSRRE